MRGLGVLHFLATTLLSLVALLASAQARAPHPSLPPPVVPEGFGVNIHFTDPQPGEMKKIAESGARWVRMDLVWDQTEREKGVYDFSAYDRLVQSLDEHGLKAMFILDYGNPHYDQGLSPHTDEGRAAFARWALAAAGRYAGKGYLWEIWNEPNGGQFWRPKPDLDAYVRLAQVVTQAFRSQLPHEALVGPASYRLPEKLFRKLFRAGVLDHWAALTIHPYRWWLNPETAGTMYARLRKLLREFDPAKADFPILSGEWGYSTAQWGIDGTDQARYLPRMLLYNLSQGIPISIWYDWKDDGDNPKEKEHRFGIVEQDFRREKPTYHAARTMSEQLGGFRFVERIPLTDSRDYLLVFERGGQRRYAAWTSSNRKIQAVLSGLSGDYWETDHLGKNRRKISAGPAGLPVTLEQGPKYLVSAETASNGPDRSER